MESRDLGYATFLLFSIFDNYDLALLSTNLHFREKQKFALLQSQFYKLNKIIS